VHEARANNLACSRSVLDSMTQARHPQGRRRGLTRGLQGNARLLTISSYLVLDHQRIPAAAFRRPMDSRNLANESPCGRECTHDAVERHHSTAHRYYRLKANCSYRSALRLRPLCSDRQRLPNCDWQQARRLCKRVTRLLAQKRGRGARILRAPLDRRGAQVRQRSGAFSSSAVPALIRSS